MRRVSLLVTTAIAVFGALLVSGCMIRGIKNANNFQALPSQGTYALQLDSGDEITGSQIQRMLDFQMKEFGLVPSADLASADVVVRWAFDVVPVGSTSAAFTSIQPGRSTATLVGNTAYIRSNPSVATTTTSSSANYQKTIAVKMFGKTNDKIWEGKVTEVGWCNQIFVTAPHILGLLFDKFQQEAINVQETVSDDARTQKFKKLFPENTNWGCKRT